MTRSFGFFLFAITINTLSASTPPVEPTEPTSPTKLNPEKLNTKLDPSEAVPCSNNSVAYRNAGKDFFDTFENMFTARLHNEPVNETADLMKLTQKAANFLKVGNESCPHWPQNVIFSHSTYINLLVFSLKNATLLKDLQNKDQFKCVNEQKPKLLECGTKNITMKSQCRTLYRSSRLNFNSISCLQTRKNEVCVSKILKAKCPEILNYTKSLFDFMVNIDECKNIKNAKPDTLKSGSDRITGVWATIMFLWLCNEWNNIVE